MTKHTERFTQTVDDYLKYRPTYPKEVLAVMQTKCGLSQESIIADVGSGTGFLTQLFLRHGNTVYGVEPNDAMRTAAEKYLKNYPNFHSINGTAEETHLDAHTFDFVTVGTAFHWFDVEKTKHEFRRILKSPGWCLLVWNVRDLNSPLINDYEKLITEYSTDYCTSRASEFDQTAVAEFFQPHPMHTAEFRNMQTFDWESFQGRLLSASYSLRPGDERYKAMIQALHEIFDRHQKNNQIEFSYLTKLYYGRLT